MIKRLNFYGIVRNNLHVFPEYRMDITFLILWNEMKTSIPVFFFLNRVTTKLKNYF